MEKGTKNKAIGSQEVKQKYFYPEHQLTVEAASKEEADAAVEKLIAKTE